MTTLTTTRRSPRRPGAAARGMPSPRRVDHLAGLRAGRRLDSTAPSSVGTSSVAPSAASGAGTSSTVTRSSPSRRKRSSARDADQDVEVAGRAAALARVAAPAEADALAVGDAGRDVDARACAARPRARGRGSRSHGCVGDLAVAAADVAGDGAHDLAERRAADRLQLPAPPQRSQVSIGVPGSAPLPWQCSQRVDRLEGRPRPSAPRRRLGERRSRRATATSPPWRGPPRAAAEAAERRRRRRTRRRGR